MSAWMVAAVIASVAVAVPAQAHETSAYSHDDTLDVHHPDWMASLPGALRVSELSIPGTHDTMSHHGGDKAQTQSLSLTEQLDAGIRVLDIRVRHIEDSFAIHHGFVFQHAFFGADVMEPVIAFLDEHPNETVFMRVKEEYDAADNTRSFDETFDWYMGIYGDHVWQGESDDPTLDDVRGKIVILRDGFSSDVVDGIDYDTLNVQDNYDIGDITGLYDKWVDVRDQLDAADLFPGHDGAFGTIYMNYLSGSDDLLNVYPYFVASGHSNPATGADRLATGKTTPGWDDWPDFPRVACIPLTGVCTIAYEGTNILAMHYIDDGHVSGRAGMVMADFPGAGLIQSVIDLNPWNVPPQADAGGPYTADEGSAISFDAGASTDADGDALGYRWDFEDDGTWDTDWSPDPTATHTFADDWSGAAVVQARDVYDHVDTATAAVTVRNVAPATSIDRLVDETGRSVDGDRVVLALLDVDLGGSFSDVGVLDTHTASVDWGDRSATDLGATDDTVADHLRSGTVQASHRFAQPGEYTIRLAVTDKDGGVGTDTASVTVVDGADAIGLTVDALLDHPSGLVRSAVDHLRGNRGGRAANGALDMLAKGNGNAALVMIGKALDDLAAAESAGAGDLSDARSLLALSAKSITVAALADAGGRKSEQARSLVAAGDELLEAADYAGAVERYRAALRLVLAGH